jgi:hypothetical protein
LRSDCVNEVLAKQGTSIFLFCDHPSCSCSETFELI